ncbi:hypothetical protein [Fusobacterium ulcerans]|nr:hypothetical protein [Fusobacterium ulcerans]
MKKAVRFEKIKNNLKEINFKTFAQKCRGAIDFKTRNELAEKSEIEICEQIYDILISIEDHEFKLKKIKGYNKFKSNCQKRNLELSEENKNTLYGVLEILEKYEKE